MTEFAPALTVFFVITTIGALYLANNYRRERDEIAKDLMEDIEADRLTIKVLEERVSALKDTNESYKREIGRMKAEAVAEKLSEPAKNPAGVIAFTPARDSKGKFLPKPKSPKAAKTKPVACG